jgi:hypothetical protein
LHLIQVGDRRQLTSMSPAELVRDEGSAGVRFAEGDRQIQVLFATTGPAGGRIHIRVAGRARVDRPLTQRLAPQAGLLAAEPPAP